MRAIFKISIHYVLSHAIEKRKKVSSTVVGISMYSVYACPLKMNKIAYMLMVLEDVIGTFSNRWPVEDFLGTVCESCAVGPRAACVCRQTTATKQPDLLPSPLDSLNTSAFLDRALSHPPPAYSYTTLQNRTEQLIISVSFLLKRSIPDCRATPRDEWK